MFIKKGFILVFVIVILSFNVYAANLTEAYEWLNSQDPKDVYEAAIGFLALREVNGGKDYFTFLENNKDIKDCWPKSSCKPKETALSAFVYNKEGLDIEKSLEWLSSNQEITLTGEWLLQIDTQNSGECDIEYALQSLVKKKINVDKGFITSEKCSTPNTKFNLGNCLEDNLLKNKASVDFDIKCSFDGKISSLYNDQGIYYINDDVVEGSSAKIKINTGNFGNYEDTLFVNWVLKELDSDINSLMFLRKNYKNDVKSNAFFYLITEKSLYANELSNLQKEDGSFGNVFETSIALLALNDDQHENQLELARKWLDLKQDIEGSWNKNIIETSLVLYSAYQKTGIDLGEKITAPEEEKPSESSCVIDDFCDLSFGENSLNCQEDCTCGDNKCDSAEKSSLTCPEDCKEEKSEEELLCGNDILDEDEECDGTSDEKCPGQCNLINCTCEEKEKSFGFLWFFIILLIIIIIGFFAYKKFGKDLFKFKPKKSLEKPSFNLQNLETKKPEKTEFKGPINLFKSLKVEKERKSKVEEELEKSLKEAKKILEK